MKEDDVIIHENGEIEFVNGRKDNYEIDPTIPTFQPPEQQEEREKVKQNITKGLAKYGETKKKVKKLQEELKQLEEKKSIQQVGNLGNDRDDQSSQSDRDL